MIQTKFPVVYGNRNEKLGVIKLEVKFIEMNKKGNKYMVSDWDITSGQGYPYTTKHIFYSNEQLNQLDALLESTYDFSGLTRTEKEWKKIELALMYDTQNNLLETGKTIYGLNPEDWEFTPVPVVEAPVQPEE